MNIIKNVPDDVKKHICLFIPVKYCMNCYKKVHSYNKYEYCSTICRITYYIYNVKICICLFFYYLYIIFSYCYLFFIFVVLSFICIIYNFIVR